MRYHTQNLSYNKYPTWMNGRAWLRRSGKSFSEILHLEWGFFKFARDFALTASFGCGDGDDGMVLHVCIPWLISVYLCIDGVYRCRECTTGIAIHNCGLWFYPLTWRMESAGKGDPWYRHNFCWNFPWQLDWYSTEVLTQHTPELAETVWMERRGDRKKLGIDSFKMMDLQREAEAKVTEVHDYNYIRKNGEIQERKAAIHVSRMTWRARWWPLIPRKKVSTSISVSFNEEIGEGVGSWKGGTVGCGYEMKPCETPWECLRRMERERKFER